MLGMPDPKIEKDDILKSKKRGHFKIEKEGTILLKMLDIKKETNTFIGENLNKINFHLLR